MCKTKQSTSIYGTQDSTSDKNDTQRYWINRNQELRTEFTVRYPNTPVSRYRLY